MFSDARNPERNIAEAVSQMQRRQRGRTGDTKSAPEINRRFRPQRLSAGKRNVEKCGVPHLRKRFNINDL